MNEFATLSEAKKPGRRKHKEVGGHQVDLLDKIYFNKKIRILGFHGGFEFDSKTPDKTWLLFQFQLFFKIFNIVN